jgi:folate-binding protein YgfZ
MTDDARTIWQLTGKDVLPFLQGLVSNDVLPLARAPGAVWAALLSPQGKYLADFFVIRRPEAPEGEILIDIATDLAPATLRRLMLYRLRADVQIGDSPQHLSRGLGAAPQGALPDPRHPGLGWRLYAETTLAAPEVDWDALRVDLMVPAYPQDLVPDDSYILEMGFERLHGVDFRKGCYVGQEVPARMKHKTELRKGLAQVALDGAAPPGTPITLPDGREAGRLGTVAGDRALAWLRLDRAGGPLLAGSVPVRFLAA